MAMTTALSPDSRMLATMMAPSAPQTAPEVRASIIESAPALGLPRGSYQCLHQATHLRRVARHRESALLHHGELGIRRVGSVGPADLADHDDRVGVGILVEELHDVDVLQSVDRVAADSDRARLPEADF